MKRKTMMAFGLVAIMLVSCKKDRICECTTVESGGYTDSNGGTNSYTNDPVVSSTTYKKVRPSDISVQCGDASGSGTSTTVNGTVTTTNNYQITTKCTIK